MAARLRLDKREDSYMHCFGHVAGARNWLPLDSRCRRKLHRLLQELLDFYTVEVMSFVAMANHWHMVCRVSPRLPSAEEARSRWLSFYGADHPAEPDWNSPAAVEKVGRRMRDVSRLVQDLQRRFACWYNREVEPGRKGNLWRVRYGSVILESGTALWECLKYVEMNPVRAGACGDPADYADSSWGKFIQTGRHPFPAFFRVLEEQDWARGQEGQEGQERRCWDRRRIAAEFAAEMRAQAARERGKEPPRGANAAESTARGGGSANFAETPGRGAKIAKFAGGGSGFAARAMSAKSAEDARPAGKGEISAGLAGCGKAAAAIPAMAAGRPGFGLLLRSVRHWTAGAVVGSKEFLRRVEDFFFPSRRVPKRFDMEPSLGIGSYRQLRK